jgi:hypothetical protein
MINHAPDEINKPEDDDVVIEGGHIVHKEPAKADEIDMEQVEHDNVEYDD